MINNLTIIEHNGVFVVDSRDVAKMVDKRHADLLESISVYIQYLENGKVRSQNFFIPHTYKVEGNNKIYDCYFLTRKGCDMVANKMTGEKGVLFTATYVTRFEEMEKELQQQQKYKIPSNFVEALRLAAELEEEKQKLKEVNQILLPKAENYDKFLNAENCQTMNEVAKVLGVGRNKLFEYLRDIGILMENNTPYQRYMNSGYFVVKESTYHNGYREIVNTQTFVTTKGLEFIESKINKGKNDKKKNAELAFTM